MVGDLATGLRQPPRLGTDPLLGDSESLLGGARAGVKIG
jgi:hypothetical protein